MNKYNIKKISDKYFSQAFKNYSLGNFRKAIYFYQKLIKFQPQSAKAYNNLALAYQKIKDYQNAEKFFKKSLKINPNFSEGYNNYGNLLHLVGKTNQAIKNLKKAIKINPNFFQAYYNLGLVYQTIFKYKKALACFKKCLKINPQYGSAYSAIGTILKEQGKLKEALAYFSRTLDFLTDDIAHYNLGIIFHELNYPEKAFSCFQQAYNINPENWDALSQLIHQKRDLCDWNRIKELIKKLNQQTKLAFKKNQRPGETPFLSVYLFENQKRNFQIAQSWSWQIKNKVKSYLPYFETKPLNLYRKKIRIGYVSCDFYNHSTYHLIKDLFSNYNRDKFETYVYFYGKKDQYTKKIKNQVDKFVDINNLSFFEAAKKIYQDKIDILVDLKGHTQNHRLEIFALRPAPIQLHFLGFPSSIGADFIDYFIADKIVIPDHHVKYFSEKIIYLPGSYQINSHQKIAKKNYSRSDFNLPKKSFVFCCFNQSYKISEEVFSLWLDILKKTKKSVLWLLDSGEMVKKNLLDFAKSKGIEEKRIIFSSFLPKEHHLKRLKLADLVLDTFPYNGHTSTSDALWAGVPVVTILGKHFASRVSASLLNTFGLKELIGKNKNQYKNLAIKLSTNREKYLSIRKKIEEKKKNNPLFDVKTFIKNLEKAYETIWINYLKNRIESIEKINLYSNKAKKKLWPKDSLVFFAGPQIAPWDPDFFGNKYPRYITDNEEILVNLTSNLQKLGWKITVFSQVKNERKYHNVSWQNFNRFNPNDFFNILIFWNNPNLVDAKIKTDKTYLWLGNNFDFKNLSKEKINYLTKIIVLSQAQRNYFADVDDKKFFFSPSGFVEYNPQNFPQNNPYYCLYTSTLDRGFEYFAYIWPIIIKKFPQAQLHIVSHPSSLLDTLNINQESYFLWKKRIDKILSFPNVFYHKNNSPLLLENWYKKSGLFIYPTSYYEINPLLAIKAQAFGSVPITTNTGVLNEVVKFGFKIPGSPKNKDVLKTFTEALIFALKNPQWQEEQRKNMMPWAKKTYRWEKIATHWHIEFKK